ncbi:hypothetical protein JF546_19660 [Nitratireductor aquimarinus]|uniref:hypothetical protein n=1 Tax=Nitratireductor aquimarinus TaxID=889300 RepID=UPI001A8C9D29|nr:hypothetical protein [Nitratireductor aquimarinus]MBN8245238.1 hypothetical protein [Nitratireductor aquimarinus]MBY6133623.1 hypothetical protein [Nitratireductor aquimarinus]MCA1304726.1 hypothetical protein [Nitratireductor aquimarinus]
MDIDELIDATARAAVEEQDEPVAMNPAQMVARAAAAGETEIAAKIALAFRDRSFELAPEVEAATRRIKAERAADNFRRINEANATNHALPNWVQNELGVTH